MRSKPEKKRNETKDGTSNFSTESFELVVPSLSLNTSTAVAPCVWMLAATTDTLFTLAESGEGERGRGASRCVESVRTSRARRCGAAVAVRRPRGGGGGAHGAHLRLFTRSVRRPGRSGTSTLSIVKSSSCSLDSSCGRGAPGGGSADRRSAAYVPPASVCVLGGALTAPLRRGCPPRCCRRSQTRRRRCGAWRRGASRRRTRPGRCGASRRSLVGGEGLKRRGARGWQWLTSAPAAHWDRGLGWRAAGLSNGPGPRQERNRYQP